MVCAFYMGYLYGQNEAVTSLLTQQECSKISNRFDYDTCMKSVILKVPDTIKNM